MDGSPLFDVKTLPEQQLAIRNWARVVPRSSGSRRVRAISLRPPIECAGSPPTASASHELPSNRTLSRRTTQAQDRELVHGAAPPNLALLSRAQRTRIGLARWPTWCG
jgi:hypothetical protein